MQEIVADLRKDYIYQLAEAGERIDGRAPEEYREIKVETGIIEKAEGSARVRIGNTQVLVGVKMDVGEPYPDTPDQAVLTTNVELVPLASPTFEPGPPDENAVELARVVDRGIRSAEAIDLAKLCIKEGEKVWVIFVDIHALDHDGNLIDTSALGAIAALHNTRHPKIKMEKDQVILKEETQPLAVSLKPVACTLARINGKLMIDPCLEEEQVMEGRITIATDDNDEIVAIQKSGVGAFSVNEVQEAVGIALKETRKLRKHI